ncbi:MAG: formylglycine-generating enzyme family protein [Planctomycetaceae bacterium]|nr:formylglycine-generating enzyme family protein [Planctomycetaceae bacterium]
MNSVTGFPRRWQWFLGGFAVFMLAAAWGCKPSESVKKPASENSASSVAKPAPKAVDEKKPAADATTPAAEAEETLTPTVLWMPKPIDNPAAEAKDQAGMKPYSEAIANTSVKFDMVPIPGGTFKMGSPAGEKDRKSDEGPQVEVQLDPFWMGKCEVTWSEFEQWGLGLDQHRRDVKKTPMTEWNKSADALAIPTKPYADMTFGMGKDGYPAVCMTQFAAKMYCKWLSAKTGRYYRLPTEAEWEYACRAGAPTAYSFGDDSAKLDDYGWSEANSDEKYHKVGRKKPNAWGLYDMHGNVAEWCLDQFVPGRYKQLGDKLVKNPLLPVTSTYPQVVRGGAWTDEAAMLRSAARRGSSPDWKSQDPQIPQSIWYFTDANFVGFRVVRPLHKPTPEEAAKYEVTPFEKEEYIDYKKAQAGKQ